MALFDTFDCDNCGTAYKAHASSNAATGGYCSPRCESEGKGYA